MKAREMVQELKREGWIVVRRGRHLILERDGIRKPFSYHDATELGSTQRRFIAKQFGLKEVA